MDNTVSDKFMRLGDELNAELLEREAEIQCAILALVSGTTFFMLGEPGIAKSLLVRRLHARISGAQFFDLDLDKFTTPDDLFGPRSLSAMKEDRWEREVAGTVVTADFAFLDEFFEASSALLKALLRMLNERTFRQGTEIIPMQLTTLFAASNEIPTDPRLAALYDRLLIRRELRRIQETGNFLTMLCSDPDEKPDPVLSWDDVTAAQAEARAVKVPDKALIAMGEIRRKLQAEDIFASDRRFHDSLKVVRAAAWLDGCDTVEPEHLRCLADILWTHPDQIPAVHSLVMAVVDPLVAEVDELLRQVTKLRRQIRPGITDEVERKRLAAELFDKVELAKRDFDVLAGADGGKKRNRRQERQLQRCSDAIKDASLALMRDLYLMPDVPGATK